ncbi:MAG: META domain-containing protein [Acidimicrobiia bacterium]|nr:META domain-containing protein [Acidimicrobiia bacterium]MDH4307994.1 META domain-containing protein [Acidimicrobiia bacterium]MDH5292430.1 META domain-containing protein [Acidimicrobiia bacterium]
MFRRSHPSIGSLLVLLALAAGLVSCSADAGDPTGRTWTLLDLQGTAAIDGTMVTITFADGQVSGSGGCNNYTGSATWDAGSISIDPALAATQVECDQPVMVQEQAFFSELPTASSYSVDGDRLRLTADDGETLATFTAAAP